MATAGDVINAWRAEASPSYTSLATRARATSSKKVLSVSRTTSSGTTVIVNRNGDVTELDKEGRVINEYKVSKGAAERFIKGESKNIDEQRLSTGSITMTEQQPEEQTYFQKAAGYVKEKTAPVVNKVKSAITPGPETTGAAFNLYGSIINSSVGKAAYTTAENVATTSKKLYTGAKERVVPIYEKTKKKLADANTFISSRITSPVAEKLSKKGITGESVRASFQTVPSYVLPVPPGTGVLFPRKGEFESFRKSKIVPESFKSASKSFEFVSSTARETTANIVIGAAKRIKEKPVTLALEFGAGTAIGGGVTVAGSYYPAATRATSYTLGAVAGGAFAFGASQQHNIKELGLYTGERLADVGAFYSGSLLGAKLAQPYTLQSRALARPKEVSIEGKQTVQNIQRNYKIGKSSYLVKEQIPTRTKLKLSGENYAETYIQSKPGATISRTVKKGDYLSFVKTNPNTGASQVQITKGGEILSKYSTGPITPDIKLGESVKLLDLKGNVLSTKDTLLTIDNRAFGSRAVKSTKSNVKIKLSTSSQASTQTLYKITSPKVTRISEYSYNPSTGTFTSEIKSLEIGEFSGIKPVKFAKETPDVFKVGKKTITEIKQPRTSVVSSTRTSVGITGKITKSSIFQLGKSGIVRSGQPSATSSTPIAGSHRLNIEPMLDVGVPQTEVTPIAKTNLFLSEPLPKTKGLVFAGLVVGATKQAKIVKPLIEQKIKPVTIPITLTATRVKPKQELINFPATTTRTRQTIFNPEPIPGPTPTPPIPTPPIPTPFIPNPPKPPRTPPPRFRLRDDDISLKKLTKFGFKIKQPKKYTPTFTAAAFNIKGKPSNLGTRSGLGQRPIPIKWAKK